MLVLTRKTDEQILIGDNIKVTLVRVRGNSVRIGIEAPRDVRVVRGELEESNKVEEEYEIDPREQVFAHPQAKIISGRVKVNDNAGPKALSAAKFELEEFSEEKTPVNSVARPTSDPSRRRAPLAHFVSAT